MTARRRPDSDLALALAGVVKSQFVPPVAFPSRTGNAVGIRGEESLAQRCSELIIAPLKAALALKRPPIKVPLS